MGLRNLCVRAHVKNSKRSKYLLRRINSHELFNLLRNKLTRFPIQNFYV